MGKKVKMNNKIKSITVNYIDSHTEEFSESLIDRLVEFQGTRNTLSEFIEELLGLLSIEEAGEKLQDKFEEKFQQQTETHKKEIDVAVKRSKSVLKGLTSEKWFPFMVGYPYKDGDVIKANHPFDYIVLDGLSEMHINKIVFQEVKDGTASHHLVNDNERELARFIYELKSDKIKFEHWARDNDNEPFKKILHSRMFDLSSEPEYLKNHKYCSRCDGYYLTNAHYCFHLPPLSNNNNKEEN